MLKTFFASLLCSLFALVTGRAGEPVLTRFSFTEPHMGTRFKIILYAPDAATAEKASRAAFQRIAELDGIMSDYRPASELMQLCKKAGVEPVKVSKDLFYVLAKAQQVAKRSDGAFDVTVGPVVRLWRVARKTRKMPDPARLKAALDLVGYRNFRLDEQKRTVQLTKPGMQLDLGGIAKGYAADEALKTLKQHGVKSALVAAGGDIAVSEAPPDAPGWTVGIAPLEDPECKPKRYLLLCNQAVSTSGDVEQHVEINGVRYSHIVDPKTGLGLIGRQSVTVVSRHGIDSDSLTKVVSVWGPKRGLEFIEKIPGTAAYVVRKTDDGEETFQTKNFPKMLKQE
jgi:thiamine biosynthesis lipoprotein